MSLEATLATWELSKKQVSSHEKYLLLSLARRAGEDHTCWPSVQRMCDDTGLDRKTVISLRQDLIDKKIIKYTGEMKGRSGQIKVMQLPYVYEWEQKRNSPRLNDKDDFYVVTSPKNGTGKKLNSPKNGTGTSPKNGTGTSPKNGTLNIKGEKNKGKERARASRVFAPSGSYCPGTADLLLSDEACDAANKKNMDIERLAFSFMAYAKSAGWIRSDWKAAFFKWVIDEKVTTSSNVFGFRRQEQGQQHVHQPKYRDFTQERLDREAAEERRTQQMK